MTAKIMTKFSSQTKSSIILLCRGSSHDEQGLLSHHLGS